MIASMKRVVVMLCILAVVIASAAVRPVVARDYEKYSKMTPEQMNKLQEYATSPSFKAQAEAAFGTYDSNADGHISLDEFDGLLMTLGDTMSPDQKHTILSLADTNNDGRINADEWFGMVTMKPAGM